MHGNFLPGIEPVAFLLRVRCSNGDTRMVNVTYGVFRVEIRIQPRYVLRSPLLVSLIIPLLISPVPENLSYFFLTK